MDAEQIEKYLTKHIAGCRFTVENSSWQHEHSSGQSHFRVLGVGTAFEGMNSLARQKLVLKLLKDAALMPYSITTELLTTAEWHLRGQESTPEPTCAGRRLDSI